MAICLTCKRIFTPGRNDTGKFCSRACYHKNHPKRKTLAERFWNKVQKSDGCWFWTGSKNWFGYGQMQLGRQSEGIMRAHRVSWMINRGPIPKGLCVLHKCDVPLCVNPDHLYLGTLKDNAKDCYDKGRSPIVKAWTCKRDARGYCLPLKRH